MTPLTMRLSHLQVSRRSHPGPRASNGEAVRPRFINAAASADVDAEAPLPRAVGAEACGNTRLVARYRDTARLAPRHRNLTRPWLSMEKAFDNKTIYYLACAKATPYEQLQAFPLSSSYQRGTPSTAGQGNTICSRRRQGTATSCR